jgi:hypothetical protein
VIDSSSQVDEPKAPGESQGFFVGSIMSSLWHLYNTPSDL